MGKVDEKWRAALDINLTSAFALTRESMRALQVQGIGGSLVFVASKNSFSPGADFGAYSVSKAGMVQLMRIAALEGGKSGIRSNAVNPDAVFDNSRLWDSGLREERAAAVVVDVSAREVVNKVAELLFRDLLRKGKGVLEGCRGAAFAIGMARERECAQADRPPFG